MTGNNYYTLTALPGLGDFGSVPGLTTGELLEYVADESGPRLLLEVIFLGDDLLQRQGYLAGEISEPNPVVLTKAQVRNEEPLPGYLAGDKQDESARSPGDDLWAAYYRYAADVARRLASDFLNAWVQYEVTLRNAVAAARAKTLDLNPADYLVADELARSEEDFSSLLNEWNGSENPFAGLRILDKGRWDWLVRHDGWFSFDDDELACYGVKLMLLSRWERITGDRRHQTGDRRHKPRDRRHETADRRQKA